jgi:hypothetical protein
MSIDLDMFAVRCHEANKNWWIDIDTFKPINRNVGELIALMHSELSEMLEGVRKNLQSEKIPGFTSEEEEWADSIIRHFDYAAGRGIRAQAAFEAKMNYNKYRKDHSLDHRRESGGKKF